VARRGEAIDRKLALVGDTTRTVLELVQDQRTVRLELYIIGLIAIEILLSVYELFGRGHCVRSPARNDLGGPIAWMSQVEMSPTKGIWTRPTPSSLNSSETNTETR
jgi:hypothetical protein